MDNADLQVLTQLAKWISNDEKCWLCTVVKTWGSSPRPVGSLLVCNEAGNIAGSLSGGCVEEDLLEKLTQGTLASERPKLLVYGSTTEEVERFNLPCGGQLHVIIEPFISNEYLPEIEGLVSRLRQRECIERVVDIETGSMTVSETARFKHLAFNGDFDHPEQTTGVVLNHTYGPRYQLMLIGAGQVSLYLADMAQKLDYQVIVCDPRQEMLDQWHVDGVRLTNEMPDDAVRQFSQDNFSAIIALTHDPRIDDMGLMEALKTRAFFVGAMGSTRTSAKRRERLLQLDLTEAEINRLHAPVGLPIGSKTPAEIAIAILAQLTALRGEQTPSLEADFRTQHVA